MQGLYLRDGDLYTVTDDPPGPPVDGAQKKPAMAESKPQ
jgi:hypothetical protein